MTSAEKERETIDTCEYILQTFIPFVTKHKTLEIQLTSSLFLLSWYDRILKRVFLVVRNVDNMTSVALHAKSEDRCELSRIFGSLSSLFEGIPVSGFLEVIPQIIETLEEKI